ncbi:MAG: sulfatase-like hydrolase/transferase, partial [Rubripirellula sp.]
NTPLQSVGPGHIHGRDVVGASGEGKKLVDSGPDAYVLSELGSRHLSHAMTFLDDHLSETPDKPFFLYYACNSNHGPYTPDRELQGVAVAGAATNVAGDAMDVRSDFIYENDVALGQLLDHLQETDDPRNEGKKLIENTIVVFTSDNGAEKAVKRSTGPFRSNKGSVYEGGHRVPFLVTWPTANVGDGSESTSGRSDETLIGLQDMFATFAEIAGAELPNYRKGETGGEDSYSVLGAWKGNRMPARTMFFNDHKEAKDHAVVAFRQDDPVVDGRTVSGKWKMFFDESLLRAGTAKPVELFDLATDSQEKQNRLAEKDLASLVTVLKQAALEHRTAVGHRMVPIVGRERIHFDWLGKGVEDQPGVTIDMREATASASQGSFDMRVPVEGGRDIRMSVRASNRSGEMASGFDVNRRGCGIVGGKANQVDSGESIEIVFDRDVVVESVAITAGNGVCGGSYRVGDRAPLAIYCVDGDIDSNDQSGILSDIGVLLEGKSLRLDSRAHYDVETPGQWRLGSITIRTLNQ